MWLPIWISPRCDNTLKPISKRAQNVLRHWLHVRDLDGAVYCPRLMHIMYDPHLNTRSWLFFKWLGALPAASDKIRFEYCLGPHEEPHGIPHGRTSDGALHIGHEDSTAPRIDSFSQTDSVAILLYNTMPSEALVRFVKVHRQSGDRNLIRYKTRASHTSFTLLRFYLNKRKPIATMFGVDATVHGSSTEKPAA